MSAPRHERGYATLMLVAVFTGLVAFVLFAQQAVVMSETGQSRERSRQEYLVQVAEAVKAVYVANLALIDADASAPFAADVLLAQAGIRFRYGLRAQIGSRQSAYGGQLMFRNVYVWLPPMNGADTTSYDAVNDVFTPAAGVAWTVVSGRDLQAEAFRRARAQLETVGGNLVAMYAAKIAADPAQDITRNYWQAPAAGCGAFAAGTIRCTAGAIMNLRDMNVELSDSMLTNPWGRPIRASNTIGANEARPPFTMVLYSEMPWGASEQLTVQEPL